MRVPVVITWNTVLVIVIGAAAAPAPARAGVILSIADLNLPQPSTGNIGPVGATPAPNNDNAAAPSPNAIP